MYARVHPRFWAKFHLKASEDSDKIFATRIPLLSNQRFRERSPDQQIEEIIRRPDERRLFFSLSPLFSDALLFSVILVYRLPRLAQTTFFHHFDWPPELSLEGKCFMSEGRRAGHVARAATQSRGTASHFVTTPFPLFDSFLLFSFSPLSRLPTPSFEIRD